MGRVGKSSALERTRSIKASTSMNSRSGLLPTSHPNGHTKSRARCRPKPRRRLRPGEVGVDGPSREAPQQKTESGSEARSGAQPSDRRQWTGGETNRSLPLSRDAQHVLRGAGKWLDRVDMKNELKKLAVLNQRVPGFPPRPAPASHVRLLGHHLGRKL